MFLTHCASYGIWFLSLLAAGEQPDQKIVLKGEVAQAAIAVAGGGIVEFRFLDQSTNPLNWEIGELEPQQEGQPYLRGHFLCLDRWGAPSEAEQRHGVPFHGEAPRVFWRQMLPPDGRSDRGTASMECELPLAGLRVQRKVQLAAAAALLIVTEEVTRTAPRGRIYNMVQHPSIAPPFLDEGTLVDANAGSGFSQSGSIPESSRDAWKWPEMSIEDQRVDLRRFHPAGTAEARHDVSSFVVDASQDYGWVTACNPSQRLLLGYIWPRADYPWLNIWRYQRDGKVAARGLEFGTTGYHQPFPQLVRTGSILGQRLYVYIDADETARRSYAAFLLKIPQDFQGVDRIDYDQQQIELTERRQEKPRILTLDCGKLFEQ